MEVIDMPVRIGKMDGHGPYYGIPLAQLAMEWSREEELELERYCEKIHRNLDEFGAEFGDEMTPMERYRATIEGKPKDRLHVNIGLFPLYAIRQLDSWADALKPIDNWRYPKLLVKSIFATVARFKLEAFPLDTFSYGEEIWGGHARFLEYGNPVVAAERPIKSMEDLEGLEVADPRKDGLYPQYLWLVREVRRIMAKYDLDNVMPMYTSCCAGPESCAWEQMLGFKEFMIGLKKNPELVKRCSALGAEWNIRSCTSIIEEGHPEYMYMCNIVGSFPLKGNEWLVDLYAKVAQAVGPLYTMFTFGGGFPGLLEWLPALWEGGVFGPDRMEAIFASEVPHNPLIDFCREHDIVCASVAPHATTAKDGPISKIEEEVKACLDYAKPYNKYIALSGPWDYWTPQAHVDAVVAAQRKYGKY